METGGHQVGEVTRLSVQPRSQSSSAISDVTSPVKLVGKIHSDSANWPGYEAAVRIIFHLINFIAFT